MNAIDTGRERKGTRALRLAFLGTGWIGRNRMEALIKSPDVIAAAVMDTSDEQAAEAMKKAPGAIRCSTVQELLDTGPDGMVIATPSAFHAGQAIEALDAGCAVFCQKPLARTAAETGCVVDAAARNDRLLGTDFSYRFLEGARMIREMAGNGDIGKVFAVDCVFHNAYGPGKEWFYDPVRSGGGCVIDLGIHLVDLALWIFDFPEVNDIQGRVFAQGKLLTGSERVQVEDFADASFEMAPGINVHLACSWKLPAGADAVIGMTLYGTRGGLSLRNTNGSFYTFRTERFRGTTGEVIHEAAEDWGGRAIQGWAARLLSSKAFDPAAYNNIRTAEVLDAIYKRK